VKVSALYEGKVHHTRLEPRRHDFAYRLCLLYLDLDELPQLFRGRWLWSVERWNLASFRRADYLGPSERPLKEAVLDRVEEELGRRPAGAVRMLSQLRTFGYVFNPVTFYFVHGEGGELEALVAEITNTPWRERHAYVLDTRDALGKEVLSWRFDKDFHVSPFFDMDQVYEWRFTRPGEHLEVHMTNHEAGRPVFHAGLACERRPLTGRVLAGALLRHPLQALRLHAAIYWQAARLFLKRTPFFTHPDKRPSVQDAPTS
jgi:DUF1365 family protein